MNNHTNVAVNWVPKSHYEVLAKYKEHYDSEYKSGNLTPLVYPNFTHGVALGLLFLFVPPTSQFHSTLTRYAVFGLIASYQFYVILTCKAFNMAPAFGAGIGSAWMLLWSASLLVFKDSKKDFWRIGRRRHNDLGTVSLDARLKKHESDSSGSHIIEKGESSTPAKTLYFKEYYPDSDIQSSLNWILDLYFNFRGVGWNWKIPGLPSWPAHVQEQLNTADKQSKTVNDFRVSRTGLARFDDYWQLNLHNVYLFIKGFLIIDLIIVIIHHDPYFWGQTDRLPPAYFPSILRSSAFLLRTYRLVVVMTFIWIGLRTVFTLAPLFFNGVLGTEFLDTNGEPWLYPDCYGSGWNVLDRGLAGAWGGWWHQTFRSAFLLGGEWLTDLLKIDRKSRGGKLVMLFTAFVFSGFLHASGSHTLPGPSNPLLGSFAFFIVQAFGILLEMAWHSLLKSKKLDSRTPLWLGRVTNAVWVYLWFMLTGPLIADDFATGGLLLFEPIMISPLRGLGLGVKGDGWYCWSGEKIRPHPGNWWTRGAAF